MRFYSPDVVFFICPFQLNQQLKWVNDTKSHFSVFVGCEWESLRLRVRLRSSRLHSLCSGLKTLIQSFPECKQAGGRWRQEHGETIGTEQNKRLESAEWSFNRSSRDLGSVKKWQRSIQKVSQLCGQFLLFEDEQKSERPTFKFELSLSLLVNTDVCFFKGFRFFEVICHHEGGD